MSKQNDLVNVIPRLTHMEIFLEEIAANPATNRRDIFLEVFNLSEEDLEMVVFFGIFNLDNKYRYTQNSIK